jgi:transketolase
MSMISSRVLEAHDLPHPVPSGVVGEAINAIRFLAVDAVERAGSGHPGTAMALAPLAYRLYTRHLRHDPADPAWFDRDRFVLSIGHASLLQYAALHLAGYDLAAEEIAGFRQWGTRTPGHPERGLTPGVDISTGPLGQGFANGVGFAMAERLLAARFNRPGHEVIDHHTWVICGDGDMMEGVTAEAASLAGHLGLGKLTVFYDDNKISLEGPTSLHLSEDVAARFAALGWQVARSCDVNDLASIDRTVAEARTDAERPTLVIVHSHIGLGTPVQDSSKAHGNPLGPEYTAIARDRLGWSHPPFLVPARVYDHWRGLVAERAADRAGWGAALDAYRAEHPELADELDRVVVGRLPEGWRDSLPAFAAGERLATRTASGRVLNALAPAIPELVGGAADVGTSTDTYLTGAGHVPADGWGGRNLHFGVREHAMGAIVNAMAAHGGLRPFGATFFAFADYLRPAIRMAALMGIPSVFIFTHDTIGLGEDGPTHQPVEQLASLRAMPGLLVLRPADAHETAQAFAVALEHDGPSALILSRQGLPILDPALVDVAGGASVIAPGEQAAIVATGSEVEVALAARQALAEDGISSRVVSMPSWELFRRRPAVERHAILPPTIPTVAVEAAATQGWLEFADTVIGMDRFGASAPADVLYEQYRITPSAVADALRALLR